MAARGKSSHEPVPKVDAPLPLVTVDAQGKFVIGADSLNLIRHIKGDIAVVTVAGLYRTGKSYILNRLLGKQQGFAIGPTVNPCTKGIYIWGSPIVVNRPDEGPLNILLVDTEGIGSIQQDQTYDVKIFSLAILLSSYFIYNSMSIIDERALDGLSLVVNLTKQISARSSSNGSGKGAHHHKSKSSANNSASELADYFPHFLWLLRDFALDLVDEKGHPITARQYLESALRERPEPSQQSKNAIRSTIKELFRERDCVTLVRPVSDEKLLKTIDSIPYNQLRPEFRQQSEELVQRVLEEAPAKQIHGQNLSGDSFAQLIMLYTDAINAGAVASIQSAWESLSAQVNATAMEEAFHTWTSGIKARYNPNRPLGDDQLQALHLECLNEAFGIYDAMSYHGPQASVIRKQLKAKLAEEFTKLSHSNREASSRFVLSLLAKLYEPLESNAKNGSIKSIEALMDAWNQLTKSYFEQLDHTQASRLVAYEEFIKFYTTNLVTTASLVTRTVNNHHTTQLNALKAELEKATKEKHSIELASVKATEENKRLNSMIEMADKRCKTLEADLAKLQAEAVNAQAQLKKATLDLNKANLDAVKANGEVAKMKAELNSAQATAQAEAAKIQIELTSVSEKYQHQAKTIQELNKELDKLKKEIATLETSRKSTEKEKSEHAKALEKTEKLLESVQAEKSRLEATVAQSTKEKDELKKLNVKLEKDLEASKRSEMGKDMASSKALDEAKKQIQELKSTVAAHQREIESKSSEYQELLEQAQVELRKIQSEAKAQSAKPAEWQKERTQLLEYQKHLESTVEELNKQLIQSYASLDDKAEVPAKKSRAKASSSRAVAADVANSSNEVDDLFADSDEEEPPPAKKKRGPRAKSTAASAEHDGPSHHVSEDASPDIAVTASPAKGRGKKSRPVPVINSMEIDDIPLPPSRASKKRQRAGDFTEYAEVPEEELRTPIDPRKWSKAKLMQELTATGVKLPPGLKGKEFYLDLWLRRGM